MLYFGAAQEDVPGIQEFQLACGFAFSSVGSATFNEGRMETFVSAGQLPLPEWSTEKLHQHQKFSIGKFTFNEVWVNLLLLQLNYQLDANYLASLRTSFLSLVLLAASTSIKKWLRLLITSRRHFESCCWKKLVVQFHELLGVCLLMRFTCPEWLIGSLITRLFESLTRRPRVKILIWYARALIWLIVARWVTRGKLSELLTLNESIEVMNGNPLESFLRSPECAER